MSNLYEGSEIYKGAPGSLVNLEGWSASGTILIPAGTVTTAIGAVLLQANFKKAGDYTCQFNLSTILQVGTKQVIARAQAELIWSVEGNSVRRKIEVFDGTAISGTGQAVRIKITDHSLQPAGVAHADLNYLVSVQVAPGTRPTETAPILLADTGIFTATGNPFNVDRAFAIITATPIAINIPEDAGVNSWRLDVANTLTTAIPPVGSELIVTEGDQSNVFELGRYNYDDLNQWIPLTPGTQRIRISSTYATSLSGTLKFGIQG